MARTRGGYNPEKKLPLLQILPIALAFLAFVFIIKFLFGGNSTQNQPTGQFIYAAPSTKDAKVLIYMSGDTKKEISGQEKSYSTDAKIAVNEGEGLITFPDTSAKMYLDKLAEVQFTGVSDGSYAFKLLNAWTWAEADAAKGMTMTLNGFFAQAEPGSVVSFFQTAVSSNAYVLRGGLTIKTKSENVRLGVGQKITLLLSESADSSKLADKIEPIDDSFRTTSLFVRHNGERYLAASNSESGSLNGTGSSLSGALSGSGKLKTSTTATKGKKIVITSPDDEGSFETDRVDIEGKIVDANVAKISFDDKAASLNGEEKTFILKDFKLADNTNNVVYKAYDADGVVLEKGVMTIYSTAKKKQATTTTTANEKATVTTYPISSEKDFVIAAPVNPYKTTDDLVRIEGHVRKGLVKYITVEGFRLTKFTPYSGTWYYFANKDTGNFNDGINVYEIRYYDKNDTLLFKQDVKIIKESKTPAVNPAAVAPAATPTATPTADASTGTVATGA